MFVFMPGMKSGPAYKLSCPYKGPYRIMGMYPNGAEVVLIDRPKEPTIRVALSRVRRDPTMDVALTQLAPVSEQPALDASTPENVSDSEQSASATGLGLQETVSNPDIREPDSLLADGVSDSRTPGADIMPDLKTPVKEVMPYPEFLRKTQWLQIRLLLLLLLPGRSVFVHGRVLLLHGDM